MFVARPCRGLGADPGKHLLQDPSGNDKWQRGQADARLDLDDVFESVKAVVSKDALMEAGDLMMSKKKRKKKRAKAVDSSLTGNLTESETADKKVA